MSSWIKERELNSLKKMENKLFAWITPKHVAIILTVIYIFCLIPLFIIGKYNFPSADDYGHASSAHATWLSTGNIFATIFAGIARGIYEWINWEGYYTCDILTAIPPIAFGERCYWVVPICILIMLTLSTMYLFYVIFVRLFKYDKYLAWNIIMILLLCSVQCLSEAGRMEGFYWYSGAVNYIFIHSLANFFFGRMITLSMKMNKGEKCVGYMIGTSVLGFFVAGGNQITMLNVGIILLMAIFMIAYHKNWKKMKMLFVPMTVYFIGMLLNIFAPGNDIRAMVCNGMSPIKAIFLSLKYGLDLCVSEWVTWPVFISFLVIGILSWKMTAESKFTYPCPVILIVLGYCITSAMMTAPLFAVSDKEAGRIQAVTYLMFLMTSIISIVYSVGWCRYQYDKKVDEKEDSSVFQMAYKWSIVTATVFIICGSALSIIANPHFYAFTSAITDLVNGDAKSYYSQMEKRMEIMYSGQKGILEFEPLTVEPKLLFFTDITTDVNAWENEGMARYLGVEGVVIKRNK